MICSQTYRVTVSSRILVSPPSEWIWNLYPAIVQSRPPRLIYACSPVLGWIKSLRLRFVGHLARTTPEKDHHRATAAALRPPPDWNRSVVCWVLPGWAQSMMTFSPWTSGSTRLGGRQELGTFGIKSSVRQRSTEEFATKRRKKITLWNTTINFSTLTFYKVEWQRVWNVTPAISKWSHRVANVGLLLNTREKNRKSVNVWGNYDVVTLLNSVCPFSH